MSNRFSHTLTVAHPPIHIHLHKHNSAPFMNTFLFTGFNGHPTLYYPIKLMKYVEHQTLNKKNFRHETKKLYC